MKPSNGPVVEHKSVTVPALSTSYCVRLSSAGTEYIPCCLREGRGLLNQPANQDPPTHLGWTLIEPRAQNTITSDIARMTFTFAFGDLAANFFHGEKGTVINFIAYIIPCQLYVPDA